MTTMCERNPARPMHDPRWALFEVYILNATHVRKDLLDSRTNDWLPIWEAFKAGHSMSGLESGE